MRLALCIFCLVAFASSAIAREYFKFTDRNGVEYWLDDKSKLPPNFPDYYRYEDRNGVVFWVNDAAKIPAEYRNQPGSSQAKNPGNDSAARRQYNTKVSINGSRVLVPVTLKHRGKKVKAKLILDSGTAVTTLSSGLAAKLKLKGSPAKKKKKAKGGRSAADSYPSTVDYIEVDGKIIADSEVMVVPSSSNPGADGQIGSSFLRFFNYSIDHEKQLLRWN